MSRISILESLPRKYVPVQKGFRKGQKVVAIGGFFDGCAGKVVQVGTMIRVQFPFLAEGFTYGFGRNTLQIVKRKKKK